MARYSCKIDVKVGTDSNGKDIVKEIESDQLLPGDIVVVPEGKVLPCDLVLLTGSTIVNEAMLTGESVPVMKSSLPVIQSEIYDQNKAAKYSLFGGTKVIQSRPVKEGENVYALVTCTGFMTTKGSLVRDILYPREISFKFYTDGYKFVAIMAFLAIVGFLCTVPIMLNIGTSIGNLIDRSLDLLTICVPPALPAAMTCGVVFSISRLKKDKISCISPNRVNVAGRVTTFVFDKTGTLTEDSLSVLGSQGIQNAHVDEGLAFRSQTVFMDFSKNMEPYKNVNEWWKLESEQANKIRNLPATLFLEAMASCTEVTYVNDELVGDPLDVKMFEATGWTLDEPSNNQEENLVCAYVYPSNMQRKDAEEMTLMSNDEREAQYSSSIIRRFEFSSALQRMSAVCKNEFDNRYRVFVKGSPEMISSLAKPETLPNNFKEVLEKYTMEGYRVIALSQKLLPEVNYRHIQSMRREDAESDLEFLGLLIMENKLKDVSTEIL